MPGATRECSRRAGADGRRATADAATLGLVEALVKRIATKIADFRTAPARPCAQSLTFTVFGVAVPKGSTKSFAYQLKDRLTGQPIMKNGKPVYRAATTAANAKTKGWAQLVAESASRALEASPASERGCYQGAVRLDVQFYLPRPKKYQTRTYQLVSVPHVTAPDLDKLIRNVKDALSRMVWVDDSQVVGVVGSKAYTACDQPPRAIIRITPVLGPEAVPTAEQPLFEELR